MSERSDNSGMKHSSLMVAGLFVMVAMLLVREFAPDGPGAIIALVAGIIALAIIVPAFIIALFRSRSGS